MVDKEERFRKTLSKHGLKGKLKLVDTFEQSHFVLLHGRGDLFSAEKEFYLTLIREGRQLPEGEIYFVVSSNPRDSKHIEKKYLRSLFGKIR